MTITKTTELACYNLAQSASVAVYEGWFSKVQYAQGLDDGTKMAPCVIAYAQNAMPDSDNSNVGLWHVHCQIIVKERAAKTTPDTSLADTIFRQFMTGSIEQDLTNNASNYLVKNVRSEDITESTEGKMWVQTLPLVISCMLLQ